MDQLSTPYESLKAAVARTGSQTAFAKLCGVSQTAVWKWLQSGKRLPAEHVLAVERATDVSRHLLRPDIYPRDPASHAFDEDALPQVRSSVACDRPAVLHHERAA